MFSVINIGRCPNILDYVLGHSPERILEAHKISQKKSWSQNYIIIKIILIA